MKEILNKYKNNKITIFEAIKNIDKNVNLERKNKGVVYTPKYIADYMIQELNIKPEDKILEPSVGHGVFLFCLLEYIEYSYELSPEQLKEWYENYFTGVDIDAVAISNLKILITIYFEKKGIANIKTDNLLCTDTLFEKRLKKYDIIIGNPPYVRTKNIEQEYLKKLKNNFKSCEKGNIDLYYAFIEYAIKNSKFSSYIVPNSYIYNNSAKKLREILLSKVYKIVDFKNKLIFKNVSTYTSILFLDNRDTDNIYYSNDLNEKTIKKVKKSELNNENWIFLEKQKDGIKIKDICKIKGGVETLNNKIYLIENKEKEIINKKEYYIKYYNEKKYLIESDILKNIIKVSKNKEMKIIFPYDDYKKIIKEDVLSEKFPQCYKYLKAVKKELLKRDKGKTENYESWYAYGRKQGLKIDSNKYHLVVSKMLEPDFNVIEIHGEKDFLLLSGYTFECDTKENLELIKKEILKKDFFNYVRQSSKPWSGKKEYYSFSVKNINNYKIKY